MKSESNQSDGRAEAADYYDLANQQTDDIEFYLQQADGAPNALELGCGTGRVTVPMARLVSRIVAVDQSPSMLRICQLKVNGDEIARDRVQIVEQDVKTLDLEEEFGLITAPFRVLQNIETEVECFFGVISKHLAPQGAAIVTAFMPNRSREELIEKWSTQTEFDVWTKHDGADVIQHSIRYGGVREDPLTLYPDQIYRRFRSERLVEEAVSSPPMRVYYPDELRESIEQAGFRITNQWGGYSGETFGEGPELVVQFTHA